MRLRVVRNSNFELDNQCAILSSVPAGPVVAKVPKIFPDAVFRSCQIHRCRKPGASLHCGIEFAPRTESILRRTESLICHLPSCAPQQFRHYVWWLDRGTTQQLVFLRRAGDFAPKERFALWNMGIRRK